MRLALVLPRDIVKGKTDSCGLFLDLFSKILTDIGNGGKKRGEKLLGQALFLHLLEGFKTEVARVADLFHFFQEIFPPNRA